MADIAASKLLSSLHVSVVSPEFVSRYTERCFGAGAGAAFFTGAAFLGAAFLGAVFLGAAFFFAGAFLVAAFGAAVFLGVGMVPPIALKVSITGYTRSWFDTRCTNSIGLLGLSGWLA